MSAKDPRRALSLCPAPALRRHLRGSVSLAAGLRAAIRRGLARGASLSVPPAEGRGGRPVLLQLEPALAAAVERHAHARGLTPAAAALSLAAAGIGLGSDA